MVKKENANTKRSNLKKSKKKENDLQPIRCKGCPLMLFGNEKVALTVKI